MPQVCLHGVQQSLGVSKPCLMRLISVSSIAYGLISVSSTAHGVASNVFEVPICFRDVPSKILQPC